MAHFDVYISGEGIAEIDGHTLVPAPGQSVHEAVLDRLQSCLAGHFDVGHSTFQLEPVGHDLHEAAHHG